MSAVKTYRRKPELLDARQWNVSDGWEEALDIADWCGGSAVRDNNPMDREKTYYWYIRIPHTHDAGITVALPGDYIVEDFRGFRVMGRANFEYNYEVEE